jgi:hypothetical protein
MMIKHIPLCTSILTLVLLTACAGPDSEPGLNAQTQSIDARGIMPTNLVLKDNNSPKPQRGQLAVMNSAQLRKALASYGGNTNPPKLKDLIDEIEASNNAGDPVPGLTGLGGIFGHAFLGLAGGSLLGSGHFSQAQQRVLVTVAGQINEYAYDASDGSGALDVTTTFTRQIVPAGAGVPPAKTEVFRYKITVAAGGFTEFTKDQCADKFFCDVMPFSQDMIDRANSLGFEVKLWAEGTTITVTDVWHKGYNEQNLVKLDPATDTEYAKLFETDANSCIDMMFVGTPPATTQDLEGPPMYCLGRCSDPMIINTGF